MLFLQLKNPFGPSAEKNFLGSKKRRRFTLLFHDPSKSAAYSRIFLSEFRGKKGQKFISTPISI
jgi:hypothetical protein